MKIKTILIIAFVALSYVFTVGFTNTTNEKYVALQQPKWTAPSSADKNINPLKNDFNSVKAGKKLYSQLCAVCHGPKGKGDGMAGAGLTPKPTNLTSDDIQSQSDGAIFWKITLGRAPMASYKDILPEKQRWQIINYIKTLR